MAQVTASSETGDMAVPAPASMQVRRLAFELAAGSAAAAPDAPLQARFGLRNRNRLLRDGMHEVVLELTVAGMRGEVPVYQASVHQAGEFDLSGIAADRVAAALNVDCSQYLYAAARQALAVLVHGAGLSAPDLPAVDFAGQYARQHAGGGEAADTATLVRFWAACTHLTATPVGDHHALFGEALAVAQMARDVLPAADRALARPAAAPATLAALGAVYVTDNLYDRAVAVYRRTVAAAPTDVQAHYNLATSLMFTGALDEAAREMAWCVERQPTFWEAWTVAAKLRRHLPIKDFPGTLERLLRAHGDQPLARERLHMALALACEDRGDDAAAFEHFVAGNAVGKARQGYDWHRDAALFDAITQGPVAEPGAGDPDAAPIFVFGMPRSGTTLVERILSSHPAVQSAGELKQFGLLVKYLSGSTTPGILDVDTATRARRLDWRVLGERYLAASRPLVGTRAHFIDKFPHHFLYVAQLVNALPNAKLVCLRRNPLDTCLANFREVFSDISPFHAYACDLDDVGHYYLGFDRLMAHWRTALPGRVLEVGYEALVADPAAETRRMLDFCGLPWDAACLAFERNAAPVATASAVQVRAPINRDAIGRWRRYAVQLEPLRRLLTRAGIDAEVGT